MCSRESAGLKTSSKSSKNNITSTKTSVSMKPAARKARTKIRKPKFLSLRLELSPESTQQSIQMPSTADPKQLNLFPLHPENSVDDREITLQDHENMAYYFAAADGGATTLVGLLNAASTSEEDAEEEDQAAALSVYGTAAAVEQESEKGRASSLVRTALRNRERDASEEKWVCISKVLEQKEEEVTSTAIEPLWRQWGGRSGGGGVGGGSSCGSARGLSLKLDYEEVLNAWSDKGSLYIEEESPQTVPDLHDDFLYNNGNMQWSRGNRGLSLWTVPEKSCGRMEIEKGEKEGRLTGQREASVLRYKEKRQSRLFAKRIRYEVRRLNAEKRPRVKGRFVKRS